MGASLLTWVSKDHSPIHNILKLYKGENNIVIEIVASDGFEQKASSPVRESKTIAEYIQMLDDMEAKGIQRQRAEAYIHILDKQTKRLFNKELVSLYRILVLSIRARTSGTCIAAVASVLSF